MVVIPGTGWSTGSLAGPIISGIYAAVPELGAIDFNSWFKIAFLPAISISILWLIGGYLMLKPDEPLNIAKDTFNEEYKKLSKMSRDEKAAAITLSVTFLLLATSSIHRLPDAAICLLSLRSLPLRSRRR